MFGGTIVQCLVTHEDVGIDLSAHNYGTRGPNSIAIINIAREYTKTITSSMDTTVDTFGRRNRCDDNYFSIINLTM